MAYDYDLGVIGAGAAGLTLAAGAAQMGARTLLVEKRGKLGGDCLHFGCVPSKTLIASARVYRQMQQGPRFGLPDVAPPPVDFARVAERIRRVIEAIQPHDSVERFCKLGVQVEFGQAQFVDEHAVRIGGETVSADKWAVATGARPGTPPIPGLDQVDSLTNETLFSMSELPSEMIVLGGGAVAVEMAQALNRLGCKVTMVQRSRRILSGEDPDMADMVQAALEEEGVRVLTGTTTEELRQEHGIKTVLVRDRDGGRATLAAPALLVALGRRPNVDGLGLDQAGVEHSARGVAVDSRMRTSQGHIYAIGDVTGRHQFTHAAGYEGGVALANAVIRFPKKADYTWMPRAVYTEPELAAAGETETRLQERGEDYEVWTERFRDNDRSLAEGWETGKIKLLVGKGEKVLGVQILGPQAGDLLGEWATALAGGVKLSAMASAVHPYPTLAEINKRVAGDVMAPKLFEGVLKKGVSWLFNYRGRACEWSG
jgi:pyruvate/2-oxoglutarate dehydrogenase complex dihydrolipoamide dehydrogenase (E3) component